MSKSRITPFWQQLVLVILFLQLAVSAEPLNQAQAALDSGDWQEARRQFKRIGGEEGRIGLAHVEIVLGRNEAALDLLNGQTVPEQILRMEALQQASFNTRAVAILRQLEQQKHSDFSPPYDFRFYLIRSTLERESKNYILARKNLSEALRRAKTVDQKALVQAELILAWLDSGHQKEADNAYGDLEELIPQIKSVWTLGRVLSAGFELGRDSGDRTHAHALKRAERELYLGQKNYVKAALALINIRNIMSFKNSDQNKHVALTLQALEELVRGGDWMGASYLIEDFSYIVGYGGTEPATVAGLMERLDELISRFPNGEAADRARQSRVYLLEAKGASATELREAFEALLSSDFAVVRAHAYLGLAKLERKRGDHKSAEEALKLALPLAIPKRKSDRDWNQAPGYALLEMSRLEFNRRDYDSALTLAREAIAAQTGNDWRGWRLDARLWGLKAALAGDDLIAAEAEFRSSLAEIRAVPELWLRSSALTSLTGTLLVERSFDADVLEPHEFLFEEYDDTIHNLVQSIYSEPSELAFLLDTFDEWRDELQKRKLSLSIGRPFLRKGIVLEVLGRKAQARDLFLKALQIAEENELRRLQVPTHTFLARLAAQDGDDQEAARHLGISAKVARSVEERTALPYVLMAGGAQRKAGMLSEALENFDFAIAQNPQRAWSGFFGRALTREKMGEPEAALSDLETALELLEERDFKASKAKVMATKARLLSLLDRDEDALILFRQAYEEHQRLEATRYWPQLALDYGRTLQKLSREEEALSVLTKAIDQLVDWQTTSYSNSRHLFERTVAMAIEQGENKKALRYLQMSRSAEVLDSIDLAEIEADLETRALLKEVKGLKNRLKSLREERAKGSQDDSLGQLLATTREEFFAKLAELRTEDPDFEALVSVSGSQLTSMQELLPNRSCLVEYFPAKNKLYIFAVTRDDFRMHVVDVSRGELEKLSRQHQSALSKPGIVNQDQRQTSRRLSRLLIEPLDLAKYDQLRIVPSGPIWRVPIGTLPDERNQPLNQQLELSYLTSSDILHIFRNHQAASERPKRSLIVGGALELRGVGLEVKRLTEILPDARALSGDDLTLPRFKAEVDRNDVVHIASHSAAKPDTNKTFIQMGPEQLGLAQVYGLNLQPGSLVVLSSCQTAVGSAENPGREVTSLASAFSTAGASTVIASRWKVDDRSTTRFFELFYRSLMKGTSRGEALRQAQLEMAKEKPHPYYWAGFSLFGDPGE